MLACYSDLSEGLLQGEHQLCGIKLHLFLNSFTEYSPNVKTNIVLLSATFLFCLASLICSSGIVSALKIFVSDITRGGMPQPVMCIYSVLEVTC